MNDKLNKFEVLTGRLQILKKPTMWIGAVDPAEKEMFIISDEKAEYKTVSYTPAVRKLFDEILDNSLDALIEHKNSSGTIKVKIDEEKISIEDDGPGIPVIKKKLSESEEKNLPKEEAEKLKNSYIPYVAWTRLFSGTNFQETSGKITIGSHGVGAKAAVIFSTKFVGTTDDGKKKCIVTATNNLENSNCQVKLSSGKSGTTVEFWPDLKRFKLEKIEKVYQDLAYQRLLCLAMTFPNIKFIFNGKKILVNDKKFLKLFSENIEFVTFNKGFIGIFPNQYDDFKFLTYVDGMHMARGGNHIEYIINSIVNPIRDKLVKKYKTIKPADIRNKLTLVCFMREFPNPKFDSQTKDTLTNATSEITSYLQGSIDFEKFAKDILKNEAIINPIIETFKIKEELKARQELKKVKKIKVKSDKYMCSIGAKKYFLICEGLSARGGLSAALGRNGYSFFAARGVPLNGYSASIQAISANEELKDISNILELDLFGKGDKTISFDKIVLANDADMDGIFIANQYIGWFVRFAPNLFKERKIARLITPLVILKDSKDKIVEYFYSLNKFNEYEKTHDISKYKIDYKKGLGSWPKDEFIELFEKFGFEYFIQDLLLDDEGKIYVDNWLSNEKAEKRKEYLRNYTINIEVM